MRGIRKAMFRQRMIVAGVLVLALYFGVAASASDSAIRRQRSKHRGPSRTTAGLVTLRGSRLKAAQMV